MAHTKTWFPTLLLAVVSGFGCTGTDPSVGAGGSAGIGGAGGAAATGGSANLGGSGLAGSGVGGNSTSGGASASGLWSMGYYANWYASQYPVSAIEWSGMTHVAMAFYTPQSNGSLTLTSGDAQLARDLVTAAHAHGVKAIASLGGADSESAFRAATASGTIDQFVTSIVALMSDPGYDGVDVDWEPLAKADEPIAIDLANRIRAKKSTAILTIPVGYINVNLGADLANYPAIAAAYDQVNLMTYGMAGAYSGWKSWHSSALYQQDSATPTSIDSSVKLYLAAGVPKNKLGIGIGFYGLCYSPPVTAPDQALNGSTLVASDGAISYANIMANYYSASAYHWDSSASASYLSFASAHAPDGCSFISYDDEASIAAKAAYAKSNGLGGVIEWEINEGYVSSGTPKNPLLTAIASSVLH